jgi:mRNA-degrading endonuclease toxin of MazEF toxin-antitoxin module
MTKSKTLPRKFRQWEIVMFPFAEERLHPAVIISNDEIAENPDIAAVNALICSSAEIRRDPKPNEETLDAADGLDWRSVVRCDRIYLLPKAVFRNSRGSVTAERRPLIGRKIVEVFRLPLSR